MTPTSDQQPSRPCTTQWTISYRLDPNQTDDGIRVAFALNDPQRTYAGDPTLCPHYENVRAFNRVLLGTGFDITQRQSAEDIRDFMDYLDDAPSMNVGLARDVMTDAIFWDGPICKVEVTVTDASPSLLSMPPPIPDVPDSIPMSDEEARALQSHIRWAQHLSQHRDRIRHTRNSRPPRR